MNSPFITEDKMMDEKEKALFSAPWIDETDRRLAIEEYAKQNRNWPSAIADILTSWAVCVVVALFIAAYFYGLAK